MRISKGVLLILFMPFLSIVILGCKTSSYEPVAWTPDSNSNTLSGTIDTNQIDYDNYDANSFDLQMTRSLEKHYQEIKVILDKQYNPNQPPTAIARWLGAVEHYGGRVEIKQDPKYQTTIKSMEEILVGLLSLVVKIGNNIAEEKADFSSASNYNAIIYFRYGKRTGSISNQQITDIVFVRK